jgi:hypothetical protein
MALGRVQPLEGLELVSAPDNIVEPGSRSLVIWQLGHATEFDELGIVPGRDGFITCKSCGGQWQPQQRSGQEPGSPRNWVCPYNACNLYYVLSSLIVVAHRHVNLALDLIHPLNGPEVRDVRSQLRDADDALDCVYEGTRELYEDEMEEGILVHRKSLEAEFAQAIVKETLS